MADYRIYTDGSYRLNVDGGWGVAIYLLTLPNEWELIDELNGSLPARYSNQASELWAMGQALKWCKDHWDAYCMEADSVEIITDSEYTYKGLTQYLDGWIQRNWCKTNGDDIAHKAIWQRLYALTQDMPSIKFRHMRGHQKRGNAFDVDIEGNNRADWLAGEGRKKMEVLA